MGVSCRCCLCGSPPECLPASSPPPRGLSRSPSSSPWPGTSPLPSCLLPHPRHLLRPAPPGSSLVSVFLSPLYSPCSCPHPPLSTPLPAHPGQRTSFILGFYLFSGVLYFESACPVLAHPSSLLPPTGPSSPGAPPPRLWSSSVGLYFSAPSWC